MIKIIDNLFVGNDDDCNRCKNKFIVIHACKTCHQQGVGYRGSLSPSHPNYLIFKNENNLYLNMVDMDCELLPKFTHPIMESAVNFIEKNINRKPILIHCNQGQSRSPSIGLVCLARENHITATSYIDAKKDFINVYPCFSPGRGIELYFMKNWQYLMNFQVEVKE